VFLNGLPWRHNRAGHHKRTTICSMCKYWHAKKSVGRALCGGRCSSASRALSPSRTNVLRPVVCSPNFALSGGQPSSVPLAHHRPSTCWSVRLRGRQSRERQCKLPAANPPFCCPSLCLLAELSKRRHSTRSQFGGRQTLVAAATLDSAVTNEHHAARRLSRP